MGDRDHPSLPGTPLAEAAEAGTSCCAEPEGGVGLGHAVVPGAPGRGAAGDATASDASEARETAEEAARQVARTIHNFRWVEELQVEFRVCMLAGGVCRSRG
jgi:hypothetical protein